MRHDEALGELAGRHVRFDIAVASILALGLVGDSDRSAVDRKIVSSLTGTSTAMSRRWVTQAVAPSGWSCSIASTNHGAGSRNWVLSARRALSTSNSQSKEQSSPGTQRPSITVSQ